jgi:hypothetical protein
VNVQFVVKAQDDQLIMGVYEAWVEDDQWWTSREVARMVEEIASTGQQDGFHVDWTGIYTYWDEGREHWYLVVPARRRISG